MKAARNLESETGSKLQITSGQKPKKSAIRITGRFTSAARIRSREWTWTLTKNRTEKLSEKLHRRRPPNRPNFGKFPKCPRCVCGIDGYFAALLKKYLGSQPLASTPAVHEIAGYMPGRMEFEHEAENEAESTVKDMVFEDPMDVDEELKLAVLDIYNDKLAIRQQRKALIFERGLLDFKKVQVG